MTFDEEMLKRALREAADELAVSEGAIERILAEARDADDYEKPSRIRSYVENTGRMRSTLMAAAACVVVLAVAVPLFTSEVTTHSKVVEFNALPSLQGTTYQSGATGLPTGTAFTVINGT